MKLRGAGAVGLLLFGVADALAAANAPVATQAPDECILAMNLARTGHLDTRQPLLKKGTTRNSAMDDIQTSINSGKDCAGLITIGRLSIGSAIWVFGGDEPKCKELVGSDVKAVLAASPSYQPLFNRKPPWDVEAGFNAGPILWDKTTDADCAMTKGCPQNILICNFSPELSPHTELFSPEFYTAMVDREKAGLDISKMTQADLDTPLGQATSGTTTAGYAVGLLLPQIAVGAALAQLW